MSLKDLGQNTAEEFFETLIYLTAYEEAREIISGLTKDIPEGPLKEAIEDALNVLAFGLIFELIRMEEGFVERIFNVAYGLVVALLGWGQSLKKRLLRGKGIKAFFRGILGGFLDKSELLAQLVVVQAGNQIRARQSVYNSSGHQGLFGAYMETKKYIVERERYHLDVADRMTQRYIETLLFKLFTANFTERDKTILRKVLNKPDVDIEDINRLSEFLFVKDDRGNIVGLSKAFLELINGLGYLHNK
jgi:hypothetical protein